MQKTGESTRDRWHKTDWEKVAKEPESIAFRREDWIHEYDAEKHTEAVFDETFKRITEPQSTDGTSLLPAAAPTVAV